MRLWSNSNDHGNEPEYRSPLHHDQAPLPPPQQQAWNARYAHPVPHDSEYYMKCTIGGILSSSPRWFMTPLEVIKGYSQVGVWKNYSVAGGLQRLWIDEGFVGYTKGLAPTAIAYAIQTGTKYTVYERLKDEFSTLAGDEVTAVRYRSLIYLAAAGCAEAVADVLMCPWEQLRVRMQTSPNFPATLGAGLRTMLQQGHPFSSIVPLWGRQVPATMTNCLTFEMIVEGIYRHILTSPKASYDASTQLCVTLVSGYLAGAVSAVVSHPADSLVSLLGKPENHQRSLREIAAEAGYWSLLTKGLGPRTVMTGTIVGFQWWIYDSFKTAMGMGTTGGESH